MIEDVEQLFKMIRSAEYRRGKEEKEDLPEEVVEGLTSALEDVKKGDYKVLEKEQQKCTRCKENIKFNYYWHYPVCGKCRLKMVSDGDFNMTDTENKIFDERTKAEKHDNK